MNITRCNVARKLAHYTYETVVGVILIMRILSLVTGHTYNDPIHGSAMKMSAVIGSCNSTLDKSTLRKAWGKRQNMPNNGSNSIENKSD